ncbi:MAG: hypothetical protein ACODAF_07920 [Actinomycetota bacterium]
MVNPGRGWLRVLRGFLLAGGCLALSLGAHVAAGGSVHVPPIMVLYGFLLSAICVAAADGQRGFGGIFAVMAVSQVILHLVASGGGHHGASATAVTLDLAMVFAHAVGAVVLSVMLAYGERVLWALCSVLLQPLLALVIRPLPVRARPRAVRGFLEPVRLGGIFPAGGATWRGPPVPLS